MSTLEIVLYVIISVAVVSYIIYQVFDIVRIKTGKKQPKNKEKEQEKENNDK